MKLGKLVNIIIIILSSSLMTANLIAMRFSSCFSHYNYSWIKIVICIILIIFCGNKLLKN